MLSLFVRRSNLSSERLFCNSFAITLHPPTRKRLISKVRDSSCSYYNWVLETRFLLYESQERAGPIVNIHNEAETVQCNGTNPSQKVTRKPNDGKHSSATQSQIKDPSNKHHRATGSWLDHGGKCSIEYLPNIKCYQITLTVDQNATINLPQSKDDLHFTMVPMDDNNNDKNNGSALPLISYYEAQLYQLQDTKSFIYANLDLLLSTILPATSCKTPSARISLDKNSISLRIQLQHEITGVLTASEDLIGNLLGIEDSAFSSVPTDYLELNDLRCRSCQNPIIEPPLLSESNNTTNEKNSTIKSVLPLPSGYWDDISDYLTCYDGHANVDFPSSTTIMPFLEWCWRMMPF